MLWDMILIRKELTMNKRNRKIWKPKTYVVINSRKTIEYETHSKKCAFDFANELNKHSETINDSTKYYVFEKIERD